MAVADPVDQARPVAAPPAAPSGPSDTPGPGASTGRSTTALFTLTAFLGAALLFLVEPLVAKLLLPDFGGSATVWSTSSLFFQLLLLAAYAYCHWSTTVLGARWQPRAHLVLLLAPVVALPIALPLDAAPSLGAQPALWLIRTLAITVGLPFLVVATTGPLLQKWFSWIGSARSRDPYFLFAASNLGSFVGLLAYPLVVEPHLSLDQQRSWWSLSYAVFLALTGLCAGLAIRRNRRTARPAVTGTAEAVAPARTTPTRLPLRRLATWLLLAFLPSTLMLGVTAHLATDVGSIPLLWVVPLAVYLGTFVAAFARSTRAQPRTAVRIAVAAALVEVLLVLRPSFGLLPLTLLSGIVTLAAVAYAAHARLHADRPPPEQLTAFYLTVSAGGALGGVLNGLVAPIVFTSVLEYPLALAAVPLLLLGMRAGPSTRLLDVVTANGVRRACAFLAAGTVLCLLLWAVQHLLTGYPLALLVVGVVATVGWVISRLPGTTAVLVVALVLSQLLIPVRSVIEQSRTFYGTYRVVDTGTTHELVHGSTVHGTQFLDDARRRTPTTYYARGGPVGDAFAALPDDGPVRVAAVGLGAGSIAAYGRPGERIDFFEIDPEVERIARDPELFSYLADSEATVRTTIGDGRLALARTPRARYDMIVLDAFSSDSIPVHLMTREAIEMYLARLKPGGVLMFHISNRVFDLAPVLRGAADDLGLHAVIGSSTSRVDDATPTRWVALGQDVDAVDRIARDDQWSDLTGPAQHWTDDYSSVLSVLSW